MSIVLVFSLFHVSAASLSSRHNRLGAFPRSADTSVYSGNHEKDLITPSMNSQDSSHQVAEYKHVVTNNEKEAVRRCGGVLLRHIQKICNGCVDRPRSSSEDSSRMKRSEFFA